VRAGAAGTRPKNRSPISTIGGAAALSDATDVPKLALIEYGVQGVRFNRQLSMEYALDINLSELQNTREVTILNKASDYHCTYVKTSFTTFIVEKKIWRIQLLLSLYYRYL